jgi:hypothetical protein
MPQLFDDSIFDIRPITIGSATYGGGKTPWGFLRVIYNDTPINPPDNTVPEYAIDPPLPPVWPYLGAGKFSSDTIYGREKMNTNLTIVRGDTRVFENVAILDGDPFDLSGYTLYMSVKKNLNDAANFFQLSSPASGIVITDALNGEFTVTIPGANTSGLPAYIQRLPYDLAAVNGSVKYTLFRGYLIVIPSLTTI